MIPDALMHAVHNWRHHHPRETDPLWVVDFRDRAATYRDLGVTS